VVANRRTFLRGAGAGVILPAALLGGCGRTGVGQYPSTPHELSPEVVARDVGLLNHALDVEHKAIAAYTAGIPLLSRFGRTAGRQALRQDLAHAAELTVLVRLAHAKGHDPAPSYDLGHPRTEREVLRLLHEVEGAQIATYLDIIPKLSAGFVRATVASILASDAQHLSVLRTQLGEPAVPAALVTAGE
jgi:hypothetical protein